MVTRALLLTFWLPYAHNASLGLVMGLAGFTITIPKVSLPLLARSELFPLAVMGTTGEYTSQLPLLVVYAYVLTDSWVCFDRLRLIRW